jgi:hypothetical protein
MKTYAAVEVLLHGFLASALYEEERSASRPGRCPAVRAPDTHWIGVWWTYLFHTRGLRIAFFCHTFRYYGYMNVAAVPCYQQWINIHAVVKKV